MQPKGRRTDCSRNAEEQTAAEEPNKKLQPESYPCEAGGLWASRARREPLVEQFAKTSPWRMRRLWLPRNSVLQELPAVCSRAAHQRVSVSPRGRAVPRAPRERYFRWRDQLPVHDLVTTRVIGERVQHIASPVSALQRHDQMVRSASCWREANTRRVRMRTAARASPMTALCINPTRRHRCQATRGTVPLGHDPP